MFLLITIIFLFYGYFQSSWEFGCFIALLHSTRLLPDAHPMLSVPSLPLHTSTFFSVYQLVSFLPSPITPIFSSNPITSKSSSTPSPHFPRSTKLSPSFYLQSLPNSHSIPSPSILQVHLLHIFLSLPNCLIPSISNPSQTPSTLPSSSFHHQSFRNS